MIFRVRPRPRSKWDHGPIPEHQHVTWGGNPVRLHHTVTSFKYTSRTRAGRIREEAAHMRLLKQIALDRGFADISYNYVAFPSGRIWIGRGERVLGAHTIGHNADPGLALVGNYVLQPVSRRMRRNVSLFVSGYLHRKFHAQRRLIPHCKTYATSCPGKKALAAFKLNCN